MILLPILAALLLITAVCATIWTTTEPRVMR